MCATLHTHPLPLLNLYNKALVVKVLCPILFPSRQIVKLLKKLTMWSGSSEHLPFSMDAQGSSSMSERRVSRVQSAPLSPVAQPVKLATHRRGQELRSSGKYFKILKPPNLHYWLPLSFKFCHRLPAHRNFLPDPFLIGLKSIVAATS